MKHQQKNGIEVLTFDSLSEIPFIDHLFSTRKGGVSRGIYESMNLSYTRGDEKEAVDENFRRIAALFGKDRDSIVCADQTHTTRIRQVTKADAGKGVTKPKDYTDIDGLITDVPGLVLATFYADCVPLYFVDVEHRAIGLSHSGWRGTVARMGQETLLQMNRAFGTRPEMVKAAIGPSICQDCYEVSEDVATAFERAFRGKEKQILKKGKEASKYQLDLWSANEIVLLEAGILPENLEVARLCTCCNSDLLFSHRKTAGKRGNLGAFLMLKELKK